MIFLFDREENLIRAIGNGSLIEAVQETVINEIQTLYFAVKDSESEKFREFFKIADTVGHYDKSGHFQLYKIARMVTDVIIEVEGVHVAHDELSSSNIIRDVRFTDRGARFILERSVEGSRWQVGYVDDLGVQSYTLYYVPPADAIKRWTERFGGEIRYRLDFDGQQITGRYIDGVEKLGRDTGKRFVHGHNALEVKEEQDHSGVYTAVIGRGKGEEKFDDSGESTGGYGRRIGFEGIEWTSSDGNVHKPVGQDYIEMADRTELYGHTNGNPRFEVKIFEDTTDPYTLIEQTYHYMQEAARPKILYSSTVLQIGDVQLGDRVHIIRKDLDVYYTTRIQKIVRDLLFDENSKVELGDYDFFRRDMRKEKTDEKIDAIENEVENVVDGARSRFEQTDDRITLEVERLDGDVQEAYSRIEQTADAIVLEVGNQITALDGKITQNTSRIEQTAEHIRLTVDKEIERLDGLTESHSSSITQMADSITSIVSFTDVDGNDIASKINQTSTTITLSAQRINMDGITRVNERLTVGQGFAGDKSIDFYNGGAINSFNDATSMMLSTPGDLYFGAATVRFDRYGATSNKSHIDFSTASSITWGTHAPDVTARFG